ncbi:vq motif-containing protein 9 [Abeliophyllum distichum]|uniref:Vq motif-containing protein 9 n=1 Tax=Abeliophyllum distichum TaxID=126358 RepID=A0ABD1SB85_9LAMI
MDKGSYSDPTVNTTSGGGDGAATGRDVHLNHVNKMSHKISKSIRKQLPPPTPPNIPIFENINQNPQSQPPQNNLQQQQPPVYNINKNDFRDVVQKLTGSPAHERPPPVSQPRPPSSRLQRIRPPPLSQIFNRPPPLAQVSARLTSSADPPQKDGLAGGQRAVQPFSPLPPLPAVHAAAESPISAYMRFLQSSISSSSGALPRWNSLSHPQHHPQPPPTSSSTASPLSFPTLPPSPHPFGCVPSPRSPYAVPSSSLTGQLGFPQLPLSPTPPVPSPRWKNI